MASDHVFYNGKAQVLTIHTPNGSKQFLAHHAKTIYAITPGLLKIRKEDNSEIEVVSGFGSMIFSNNQAEVLVDTCETQEELECVCNLHVHYGQGYYLGLPDCKFNGVSSQALQYLMQK